MTIWLPGDVSDRLKQEILEFTLRWMYTDDYRPRLPNQHIHVVKQGSKLSAGIYVVCVTQTDLGSSWPYTNSSGHGVIEERHAVGVYIKADKRSGGVEAVTSVASTLRSLYACRPETLESQDLISHGVYDLFESMDQVGLDPGTDEEEGIFETQQISLMCNTEMYLKPVDI